MTYKVRTYVDQGEIVSEYRRARVDPTSYQRGSTIAEIIISQEKLVKSTDLEDITIIATTGRT